jgi:hypothetical protein
MRKNKKKIEEPISGPGWTAYGEDSGNYDLEDFFEDEMDSSYTVSRRSRFAWKAQEKISNRWFKTLVKYFGRSVFDIGRGDFGEFVQMKRFAPRARYLLKNEWTTAQFGIYLIEYSIIDGVASSFYSLNYGVRYVFFMESQLNKNQKTNEKILINLFKETEEFLHKTLADRTPPYTPDYLFR